LVILVVALHIGVTGGSLHVAEHSLDVRAILVEGGAVGALQLFHEHVEEEPRVRSV
jgi:hypothetical protein